MITAQTCPSLSSHSNTGEEDIVLVYPGKFRAPDPQVPLAILHIAASLQQEGFNVHILDMRLNDYRRFVVGNPLFVGISCMSGLQIKYALEFAKQVRQQNPSVPLVWGGVHPTLLPEQTICNDLVDIVVRGEGELIIKDLANALSQNQPLEDVTGITYKINDAIKSNPDGKVIDLDEIPVDLPYELLDMNKYPSFRSGRFHIQTSRGCPHRCGFCYNTIFNKNRWRAKCCEKSHRRNPTHHQQIPPHKNHRPNRRQRLCRRIPR